jgi:hypothetical protein
MPSSTSGPTVEFDPLPPQEPGQIDKIVELTGKQLERRYADKLPFLRGVHPKDHGCVEASFTVSDTLPDELRVGLFRQPGANFRAAIRFSNASPTVGNDTPQDVGPPAGGKLFAPDGSPVLVHGSRGMAIKLYDVEGERLVPDDGERSQDFLMINQPVFAFANVEDYEALSKAIETNDDFGFAFFARLQSTDGAIKARAERSLEIVQRIKSRTGAPPFFQDPPLSPLDNAYFSAAPFLFGEGRVMKFSARPVNPATGDLGDAIQRADYLREALRARMDAAGGDVICFDFQVQVRDAASLDIDKDIEDMCTLWPDDEATGYPFRTVARIEIPQQDIATAERQKFCEQLVYTPWHGLAEHRPLGGINRMRRKVYEESARLRCPVAPRSSDGGADPGPDPELQPLPTE